MNEHALFYTFREMWQYLDLVATFLTETGKVLKTIPSSEKGLLRQGLRSRYNNSFTSKQRYSTPQTKNKAIPFITGDNGQLLPGKQHNNDICMTFVWWLINAFNCRSSPLFQWWNLTTTDSILQRFLWPSWRWSPQRKTNDHIYQDSESIASTYTCNRRSLQVV